MANTVIQLRKSSTPSSKPTSLEFGELAINYADGKLYYKNTNSQIAEISGAGGGGGNAFGTVNANGVLVVADTPGDVLTLESGQNITIVGDAINDKITISAPNVLANATGTFAGSLTITEDLITRGNVTLGDASTDKITLNGSTISLGNNQSINSGTLFVDATNNRVGIGTSNAQYKLDVAGTANINGTLLVLGSNVIAAIAAGNTYAGTVGDAANTLSSTRTNAANGWANTISLTRASAANLWTNTVFGYSNTYAQTVGAAANGWANTVSGAAFTQANTARNHANAAFEKANTAGAYFQGNNGDVGSATGLGDIFRVHTNTLTANVTIYSGNNALAAGPITIQSGKSLTIQDNARVAIV